MPLIFNLRRDPYERAYRTSNTYYDWLIDRVFGAQPQRASAHRDLVHAAVMDKNWFWINDFKIPNGVHVFGRRYNPFGPANYPFEIDKIREMTAIRDEAVWAAAVGETIDLAARDEAGERACRPIASPPRGRPAARGGSK